MVTNSTTSQKETNPMTQEKNAESKAKMRKAAPNVIIADPSLDLRKRLIDDLDKSNPEFKHMFQSAQVKESELRMKGQEKVFDKNGDPVMGIRGDIVVRVPKDTHVATRDYRQSLSRNRVTKVINRRQLDQKASPKDPIPEGD